MFANYTFFEILFAILVSILFINYPISVFNSYKYVKNNLNSICGLLFGNPNYYKDLDWSNHFLIEMAIGSLAALKFREVNVLRRTSIFSRGYLPLAPNMNDKNFGLLIKKHGKWYKSVVINLLISSLCLVIIGFLLVFMR